MTRALDCIKRRANRADPHEYAMRDDAMIAERMGMSRHMVRKVRLRAEKKLREMLENFADHLTECDQ